MTGGATFWETSVTDVSKNILPFEEDAYFTALAETTDGSGEFAQGILEQQWQLAKAISENYNAVLTAPVSVAIPDFGRVFFN